MTWEWVEEAVQSLCKDSEISKTMEAPTFRSGSKAFIVAPSKRRSGVPTKARFWRSWGGGVAVAGVIEALRKGTLFFLKLFLVCGLQPAYVEAGAKSPECLCNIHAA